VTVSRSDRNGLATTDEFLGGGCLSVHEHDENTEAGTPDIRAMSVRAVTTQAEQATVLAAVRPSADALMDDEGRLSFLERRVRAPFEVRWVTIEPGSERTCDGAEWLDALVVLELGSIELEYPSGISRSFETGGVLCLSRLSRGTLRNRGPDLVLLAVVSRVVSTGCGSAAVRLNVMTARPAPPR
jgi:hypothetical protein